jgi:cytidyltransferase-like protein
VRVGIFGGSFNPPHLGHLNSLETVLKKTGLDAIHVVPAAQNPLKTPIDGPTPKQRFEMVSAAVSQYGSKLVILSILSKIFAKRQKLKTFILLSVWTY